ncbi:MAG: DNA repair protein RecN, partial [Gammaproteobacteria bacterium]
VLCVTHLPQVASRAHNHLKVKKRTENNSTSTGISELNQAQRVEEIARMLGGIEITENSINHAREMLAL